MSDEVLIKVENVSKKFCKDFKTSLKYGLYDLGSEILGKKRSKDLRQKEFWAVKDVSFELKRGDCLGLIGKNGAGKSTLLKMLNGLIKPDKGRIEMHGRVAAIIELGAGFNPILTGRENIYNNAAVLGFKKKEIDALYDEIVQFSEIGDYINTPVQYYSSGMKVRLGFSVAVHLKPDVLILDEVLAVGDAGFKMKSLNKMYELISSCAVIFVNHAVTHISRVSNKILYMKKGTVAYLGEDVIKGIELYQTNFEGEKGWIEYNKEAQIENVFVSSDKKVQNEKTDVNYVHYGDNLHIEIGYKLEPEVKKYCIGLVITNKDMIGVASSRSDLMLNDNNEIKRVRLTFPEISLTNGEYSITIHIQEPPIGNIAKKFYATYRNWVKFYVVSSKSFSSVPFDLRIITQTLELT